MTTQSKQSNTLDIELTFEQCQEVDKYLEDYKNNPSNSNKYRTGLHAYINELITSEVTKAVNQIIGEDESMPEWGIASKEKTEYRNELRDEQRQKLKASI